MKRLLLVLVILAATASPSRADDFWRESGRACFFGAAVLGVSAAMVLYPAVASGATTAATNSVASAVSGVTIPTLDLAAKSAFNGGGSTTTRLDAANRTAVTVVDVLPNGNLVVEGTKILRANKTTQYAYMRGVVRQFDVQRDNTVLSSNIADAQVEFIPSGDLTEAEKKGWLLRAWDKVKPIL